MSKYDLSKSAIETGSQVETEILRVLLNSNAKRRPLRDCLKNLNHLPYGFVWATIAQMEKEGRIKVHRLKFADDDRAIELEQI